jgi:hypothetical protein
MRVDAAHRGLTVRQNFPQCDILAVPHRLAAFRCGTGCAVGGWGAGVG